VWIQKDKQKNRTEIKPLNLAGREPCVLLLQQLNGRRILCLFLFKFFFVTTKKKRKKKQKACQRLTFMLARRMLLAWKNPERRCSSLEIWSKPNRTRPSSLTRASRSTGGGGGKSAGATLHRARSFCASNNARAGFITVSSKCVCRPKQTSMGVNAGQRLRRPRA
jgi:hypothetical protein